MHDSIAMLRKYWDEYGGKRPQPLESGEKNLAKKVAKPRTARYTEVMMSDDPDYVPLWPELPFRTWVLVWSLVLVAIVAFILLVPPHPLWTEVPVHDLVPPIPAGEVTTIAPVFETP